jgi:hypothetical protein
MLFRKLSIVAAVAGLMLAPSAGFAAPEHHNGARSHTQTSRSHVGARAPSRHATARQSTRRHVTTGRATRSLSRQRTTHRAHRNLRVGSRYSGGVWYGAQRHYWRGRWYAYGVGECWLRTPIGYMWVCG